MMGASPSSSARSSFIRIRRRNTMKIPRINRQNTVRSIRSIVPEIIYFAFIAALSFGCYRQSAFHPDVTGYAGSFLTLRGQKPETVHAIVFDSLRKKYGDGIFDSPSPW